MSEWRNDYETKTMDVKNAISEILPNKKIFLASYCSEPQTLVEELVKQKERIEKATLYLNVLGSKLPYAQKDCLPYFNIRALLPTFLLKDAWAYGDCDYIPINLSEIPRFINQSDIDVALIQVSPPDENGYCNLGISVVESLALIERAKFVIAEVNEQMPFTHGDTKVHVKKIDRFVKTSRPLIMVPPTEMTDIGKAIGENVAQLVPNGATIQVGVGNLANDVLVCLKDKRDLGVHSGSITDEVVNLIENGVVTNSKKTLLPNKTVCTTLVGTEQLYRYAHNNSSIELYPADFTHSGKTIAQIDYFHAINSALDVDLTGQVNAEAINGNIVAGVGGQMDFFRGAQYSKGGKSIVTIPSTTNNGKYSRIKVKSEEVTSVKTNVDYVVTEYGIAELFGKSLNERAEQLIKIAHPKFREQLKFEWDNR